MDRHNIVELEQIGKEIYQENKKRKVVNEFPKFSIKYCATPAYSKKPQRDRMISDLDGPISSMQATAENRAFRYIYSCRKYIGQLIVFVKRVVRKCLKWYIEPVCDQQTIFNQATVTAVEILNAELLALRENVEGLNAKLQAQAETSAMDAELQELREVVKEQRPKYEFGSILSSAQSGEDAIVAYILDSFKIPFSQCTYLDLGANRPKAMSNSYMFYRFGARGVLVEANPMMIPQLEEDRPGDVILNKCVAEESGKMVNFFVMNGDGLSTPDYDYALECMRKNPSIQIDKTVSVETISLSDILNQYFREPPVLVSVDVEGHELELLQALELQERRPVIIIVETIPYSPTLKAACKNESVISYMESMGYAEYAFTGINSIFVDTKRLP